MVRGFMLLLSTLLVTWQYEPNGGPISFFVSAFLPKNASKGEILSVLVDEGKSKSYFAELITRWGISISGSKYGRLKMVQRMVSFKCLIILSIT